LNEEEVMGDGDGQRERVDGTRPRYIYKNIYTLVGGE